jgi:hypothetical protein
MFQREALQAALVQVTKQTCDDNTGKAGQPCLKSHVPSMRGSGDILAYRWSPGGRCVVQAASPAVCDRPFTAHRRHTDPLQPGRGATPAAAEKVYANADYGMQPTAFIAKRQSADYALARHQRYLICRVKQIDNYGAWIRRRDRQRNCIKKSPKNTI